MKCLKLTFRTPLAGNIELDYPLAGCDASDTNDYIELSAKDMVSIHARSYELEEFMDSQKIDLADCAPADLCYEILSAEFGELSVDHDVAELITTIYVRPSFKDEDIDKLRDWITGQMSDGWGEGVEQREFSHQTLGQTVPHWDPETLEFEDEEQRFTASYFADPWTSKEGKFYVILQDMENVEKDFPEQEPIIVSSECKLKDDGMYEVRYVCKTPELQDVVNHIKNSGAFYDENFLKWVYETGPFGCAVFYHYTFVVTGTTVVALSVLGVDDRDVHRQRILKFDDEGRVLEATYDEEYEEFIRDMYSRRDVEETK